MMALRFCIVLCLAIETCFALFYKAHTDAGIFIGKIETISFKNRKSQIITYLGIPYASEPSDWKRFRVPRATEPFQTPYNATYTRPSCLQTGYGQSQTPKSENCLNLNIYAPVESTVNPEKKYPVLVYIHGGDFKVGSSNDVFPEILSSAGDVIVVTLNYRLGVFGFLNNGDYNARGNYGLWDQQLAIKWVRYHIAYFGGDVERITLIGQEAGAASVMFQAMYPGNRGLFQKVIAMSGSSLSPWSLHKPNAKQFGKALGCFVEDADDLMDNTTLVECIRNKSTDELLKASTAVHDVGPCIDGDFISDHPYNILFPKNETTSDAREFFRSLNIVVGVNDNDGSRKLIAILTSEFGISNLNSMSVQSDAFEQVLIPDILENVFDMYGYLHDRHKGSLTYEHVKYSVLFQYTNWSDPENSDNIRDNLLRLSTDINFAVPAARMADAYAYLNTNASIYMYHFVHRPTFNNLEPTWIRGAGRGAETIFMFGFPPDMVRQLGLNKTLISKEEMSLAENMITWISNFAKSGNPNEPMPLTGNDPLEWPKYDAERSHIRLSTNMSSAKSTKKKFGEPSTSFWVTLIPALLINADEIGAIPPQPPGSSDKGVYLTVFHISSMNAERTIIALMAVSLALLILIVITIWCACSSQNK